MYVKRFMTGSSKERIGRAEAVGEWDNKDLGGGEKVVIGRKETRVRQKQDVVNEAD